MLSTKIIGFFEPIEDPSRYGLITDQVKADKNIKIGRIRGNKRKLLNNLLLNNY